MIPGVNPRQLKQMMKQMGMSQTDLDVKEILIKTNDGKTLVFENPSVQKVVMQGQQTYQISAAPTRIEDEVVNVVISDDDVEMVSSQANVSKEEAKKALEETNGDIAEAIIKFD